MKCETGRNTGVDLIKAIAIYGVVIIHTCRGGYSASMLSFDWLSTVFIRSLVSASVPLFFMCSGALLLSPEKPFSMKSLYSKRLLRIVVALFLWACAYKFFDMVATHSLSFEGILQSIKDVVLFNHKYHLYYLHILIILYIWLPIVRVFTAHATEKELRYLMGVWFVFGIMGPTVQGYWPFTLFSGIPQQWAINMTYAAIGYAILGYYVSKHQIPRRWSLTLLTLGLAIVFGGTVLTSVKAGAIATGFLEGMSVGVSLMAFGAFGLFSLDSRIAKLPCVRAISNASFCIFFVHVMFISIMQWLGAVTFSPNILSIPLLSLVNVLLSYGVYAVMSRIPIVKDWLV